MEKKLGQLWQRYDSIGTPVPVTMDFQDNKPYSLFKPSEKVSLFDLQLSQYVNIDACAALISRRQKPYFLHDPVFQAKLRKESGSLKYCMSVGVDLNSIYSY